MLAGVVLGLGLADAAHRGHVVAANGPHGGRHIGVGHVEVQAPLGVADEHVADAQPGQHLRTDLAGEGAPVPVVAVLGPEGHRDGLRLDQALDGAQIGERRVDRDVDPLDVGRLEP